MGCKHRILSGDAMLILYTNILSSMSQLFYAIGKILVNSA
jgi:hypothetical protein